jgi:hypothetical protein
MPRRAQIAVVALTAALLAGCGGDGNKTVAHVGGEAITQKQLDAVVAHFRAEAQREGKSFPTSRELHSRRSATSCSSCSSIARSYGRLPTASA